MRDLLKDFNRIVKEERSKYFSQLIAANPDTPRLLFKLNYNKTEVMFFGAKTHRP